MLTDRQLALASVIRELTDLDALIATTRTHPFLALLTLDSLHARRRDLEDERDSYLEAPNEPR
jgi:hypothetical protein